MVAETDVLVATIGTDDFEAITAAAIRSCESAGASPVPPALPTQQTPKPQEAVLQVRQSTLSSLTSPEPIHPPFSPHTHYRCSVVGVLPQMMPPTQGEHLQVR
jgi:hypothetical protein